MKKSSVLSFALTILARGGSRACSPMDKGSNNFDAILKQGDASFVAGLYRKAISEFTALTAQQQLGIDEKDTFAFHRRIIACHGRLGEVSIAELVALGRKADLCFLSIRRLCVTVTS